MEISQISTKEIEQIISNMQCPKDFECHKFEFEKVSPTRDLGVETFVECLSDNPTPCTFSLTFGNKFFCKCPLRVYIKKKLGR